MPNPQITIPVPQGFINDLNKFMSNVQKIQAVAQKTWMSQTPTASQISNVQQPSSLILTGMRSIAQRLTKITVALQSGVDRITYLMGSVAKIFTRGLWGATELLAATIMTPISWITGGYLTGSFLAAGAAWITKFLWDKMVSLGDSMLQDWLLSSGIGSTVGGVRAFRATFAGLPADPAILTNVMQARFDISSRQLTAIRILGLNKQYRDTVEMAVSATLAASEFMKSQPRGWELAMAERMGLTTVFSQQYLIALQGKSREELVAMAKNFILRRHEFELTDKAVEGWKQFSLQVKALWVKVEAIIGEKLADPKSDLVKGLTEVNKLVNKFLKAILDLIFTENTVNDVIKLMQKFTLWMKDQEGSPDSFIKTAKEGLKELRKAIVVAKNAVIEFGKVFDELPPTRDPNETEKPSGIRPSPRVPGIIGPRTRFPVTSGPAARSPEVAPTSPRAPTTVTPGRTPTREQPRVITPPGARAPIRTRRPTTQGPAPTAPPPTTPPQAPDPSRPPPPPATTSPDQPSPLPPPQVPVAPTPPVITTPEFAPLPPPVSPPPAPSAPSAASQPSNRPLAPYTWQRGGEGADRIWTRHPPSAASQPSNRPLPSRTQPIMDDDRIARPRVPWTRHPAIAPQEAVTGQPGRVPPGVVMPGTRQPPQAPGVWPGRDPNIWTRHPAPVQPTISPAEPGPAFPRGQVTRENLAPIRPRGALYPSPEQLPRSPFAEAGRPFTPSVRPTGPLYPSPQALPRSPFAEAGRPFTLPTRPTGPLYQRPEQLPRSPFAEAGRPFTPSPTIVVGSRTRIPSGAPVPPSTSSNPRGYPWIPGTTEHIRLPSGVPLSYAPPTDPRWQVPPSRWGPGNWDNYMAGLAYKETTYNGQTVTSGNRGFFQQNGNDVRDAQKRGVANPQNINAGTYQQQLEANKDYIQKYSPAAAEAIERGDFATADRLLNKHWVSLPGGSQSNQRGKDGDMTRQQMFDKIRSGEGRRPPDEVTTSTTSTQPPKSEGSTPPGASPKLAGGNIPAPANAPNGNKPKATIVHYTESGKTSTPQSIVGDWKAKRPHVGSTWIVDKDGKFWSVKNDLNHSGTVHIDSPSTPKDLEEAGITNDNITGIEVMTDGEKGVPNQKQIDAVNSYLKQSPDVHVLTHSEVNPGHRLETEGQLIVEQYRQDTGLPTGDKGSAEAVDKVRKNLPTGVDTSNPSAQPRTQPNREVPPGAAQVTNLPADTPISGNPPRDPRWQVPSTRFAEPPKVSDGHGGWSDLPASQHLGASGWHPESVSPKLREILSASKQQFEAAHPGYTIVGKSGRRPVGAGAGPHFSKQGAIDMAIVDPQGNEISNEGNDPTGLYHEYARMSKGEQMARYPELNDSFAWGGAFGTQKGGGGPPDLMHFDLEGERGHWTQNQMSNMGPWPGLQYGKTSEPPWAKKLEQEDPGKLTYDDWVNKYGKATPDDPYNRNILKNMKLDNRSDWDAVMDNKPQHKHDSSPAPSSGSDKTAQGSSGGSDKDAAPKSDDHDAPTAENHDASLDS